MSCTGTSNCTCGCCAGTSVQTPVVETNPPGQPAISYRAGTWATFKESMLARLASSDYPALAKLRTRDDDDFTIAFLDATSVVLDILTFYQERLANESYLRTAVQLQSLTELSRLIGYQPSPGVSASAYLAFTLKAATGQAPNPSNPAITIPQGSQVQSVPAQGQKPQTFETSADIQAKSDWNALDVQTGVPWIPPGANGIYLSGTSTQLNPGDSLLILGVKREAGPGEQWDVVVVNQVETDNIRQLTYVTWDQRLLHESGDGTSGDPSLWTSAKVFAFRQKAGLFGNNAPNPNLFASAQTPTSTSLPALIDDSSLPWQWFNYEIASGSKIDLDATYSKIVAGSWFALTTAETSTKVLVLDDLDNLWLVPAPLGSIAPSAGVLVDQDVLAFQALSDSQIFVLGNDSKLRLEEAPFGSGAPAQVQVDEHVAAFQALSAEQVFVLGNDGNLWLEQAPFGKGIPARAQVDATAQAFQALSASQVFVLGTNGNLWREQAPFGGVPPARIQVGSTIQSFYAASATSVLELTTAGVLYNATQTSGNPFVANFISVDIQSFQGFSSNLMFALVGNDLYVVQNYPSPVGLSHALLFSNVEYFEALSPSEVLFADLGGNLWLGYGPPGSAPSAKKRFDAAKAKAVPTYVAQLFEVQRATTTSLSEFGMSGKVTELTGDFADPNIANTFSLPATQVWAQSNELTVAQQPLDYPLYGSWLDLQDLRPDLAAVTVVAVSGNAQKITVAAGVDNLSFVPDDGSTPMALHPGDVLTISDPTPLPLTPFGSVPDWPSWPALLTLSVTDSSGRPGSVQAFLSNFTLADAASTDPVVQEYAVVQSVNPETSPYAHTGIVLQYNLLNCYNRYSASVNANVGLATQGASVTEILGNGSASTPDQSFTLKQSPLTYIQAPTPTGRQSTLDIQANGVNWTEVPSLYAQGPSAQVFSTLTQPGAATEVLFGDGVEGSVLPTGQNNIQANYRVGLGSAGNVAAGAITTLIDRPLGVSGVINPGAATGGQDPDSVDDIRSNAPQTVLTLGRAVSITDYQNYASTFAGIVKAYAIWIPNGPGRGVFLTVAGVDGVGLQPGDPTLANLTTSLQNYGNPLVPITAVTFIETLFGISAQLAYQPNVTTAAAQTAVKALVLQALYQAFSFEARTFGQGVSADEVATVIQGVPGVLAVNVTGLTPLYSSTAGDLASQGAFTLSGLANWLMYKVPPVPRPSSSPNRICPYLPVPNPTALPLAAEILVLDPDPNQVKLEVMP